LVDVFQQRTTGLHYGAARLGNVPPTNAKNVGDILLEAASQVVVVDGRMQVTDLADAGHPVRVLLIE